ncbi:MAG: hypothetical protein ACR2GF_03080 [Acidimicrobiales bacterium]
MSDDERRKILAAVAGGLMAPAEAADALDALGDPSGDGPTQPPPASLSPPPPTTDLVRVRVLASARVVRVVGDAGVREAVADGPHELRREGDTLVVSGDSDESGEGSFVSSGPGWRVRARVDNGSHALTVRMNPDLALDAELSAGSLDVRGVRGPISGELAAANVRIAGFAAPIDLDATAGRIDASGVLDGGSSRVRCQAGRVTLRLEHGSSVRISGRASVGRMVLPGDDTATPRSGRRRLADERQVVVGGGSGTLDVEVNTGTAVVRADP